MSSGIAREAMLALGLVVLLLGSMWVATGSFPPLVVVESGSMMHEDEGSLGAIDPGDLVLVMDPERIEIVTFVEATEAGNDDFGFESHGMAGDVIIFQKNGGSDTPVIHRALLRQWLTRRAAGMFRGPLCETWTASHGHSTTSAPTTVGPTTWR